MKPPAIRLAGAFPVDGDIGDPYPSPAEGLFGGIGVPGIDPNVGHEASTSQGSGADQADPGSGGGGPAAFCFEWFGLKWGKEYASVYDLLKFENELYARGQSPKNWACDHRTWYQCLWDSTPSDRRAGLTYWLGECEGPPPPDPASPLEVEVLVGEAFSPVAGGIAIGRGLVLASAAIASLVVTHEARDLDVPIGDARFFPNLGDGTSDRVEIPAWNDILGAGETEEISENAAPYDSVMSITLTDIYGRVKTLERSAARVLARVRTGVKPCPDYAALLIAKPPMTTLLLSGTAAAPLPPGVERMVYGGAGVFAQTRGTVIIEAQITVQMFSAIAELTAQHTFDVRYPTSGGLVGVSVGLGKAALRVLGPALSPWRCAAYGRVVLRLPSGALAVCVLPRTVVPGNLSTRRVIPAGPLGSLTFPTLHTKPV